MILDKFKIAGLGAVVFSLAAMTSCQAGKLYNRHKTIVAVSAERDGVIQWADSTCALTVADFKIVAVDPKTKKPVETDRQNWGRACFAEIRRLVAFERDTLKATNGVLAARIVEDLKAAERDRDTAQQAARNASAALTRLRRARANVQPDKVGADYWAALDASAGLLDHDPAGPADPGRGGGGDAAQPAG